MNLVPNETDEEIINRIIKGDVDLYSVLISRYQDKLIRYVYFMVRNYDYSADIVQDTFIKTYINLKGFKINNKFSSWIYRIAHNETLNFIKKHKRIISLPDEIDLPSDENLELNFEKKESYKKLSIYIKMLDRKYSEPLILFYFEKKSYLEIGEILRMPKGTVAIRISRAKRLIKKYAQEK